MDQQFIYNVVENRKSGANYLYQIQLSSQIIKVYNSDGKIKIVRKLKIPGKCKIIATTYYILCQHQNKLTIIHLFDPTLPIYSTTWNFDKIIIAKYQPQYNLIFIVDQSNNLYQLEISQGIKIKKLYSINQRPTSFGVKQKTLFLFFQHKKQVHYFQLDEFKIQGIKQNVLEMFIEGTWQAYIVYKNEETVILKVNNIYEIELQSEGKYFFCYKKKSLICINYFSQKIFLIHNKQIIKIENCSNIEKLKLNRFLFQVYQTYDFNIKVIFNYFDQLEGIYKSFWISSSQMDFQNFDTVVAKNIHKIFKSNGFINPQFYQIVLKVLKYYQTANFYQIQAKTDQKWYENDQQIAYKFLKHILNVSPHYLPRISKHIIQQVNYLKEDKIYRFQYNFRCIINQCFRVIIQQSQTKYIKMHQKLLSIESIKYLIRFLQDFMCYFRQDKLAYSKKDLMKSQVLNNYLNLISIAKSLVLIIQIVTNKQLDLKVEKACQQFKKYANYFNKIYQANYSFQKNTFQLKLCHQYFKKLNFSAEQMSKTIFINALIQNSQNFYQTAYFFAIIMENQQIPNMPEEYKSFYKFLIQRNTGYKLQQLDTSNIASIAALCIQIQEVSFMKYICQLSIITDNFQIGIMILQSYFSYQKIVDQQFYEFAIKIYILGGFNIQAFYWVTKMRGSENYKQFFLILLKNLDSSGNLAFGQKLELNQEEKTYLSQYIKKQRDSDDEENYQLLKLLHKH